MKWSFVGYAHKGHLQFSGKTFVGFMENPVIAKKKDEFYKTKIRITIEELPPSGRTDRKVRKG